MSVFLDYLVECRVYGVPASALAINKVIERYLALRMDADTVRRSVPSADADVDEWHARGKPIADALHLRPLTKLGNTTAAINKLLLLSITLQKTQMEAFGVDAEACMLSMTELIRVIDEVRYASPWERKALKCSSMLANVTRTFNNRIPVHRGLINPATRRDASTKPIKTFPLDRFSDLIESATSWRDKSVWLLEGGTGVRQ